MTVLPLIDRATVANHDRAKRSGLQKLARLHVALLSGEAAE